MRPHVVGLVIGREIAARARTRTFLITTLVLVIGALAAVVIPAAIGGGDDDDVRVAVAAMPADLPAALERAGVEFGRPVEVSRVAPDAARAAVDGDDADLALVGDGPRVQVIVREDLEDTLRALVMRAVADAGVRDALARAGLTGSQVAEALAPPQIVVAAIDPDPVDDDARWVAVVTAIALVLALAFSGALVSSGVAEEKTTRISEVLLAAVRPGELLLGKVLGVGMLALGQMAAVIVPAAVAVVAVGALEVPDAAPLAIGAGLMWFVLGFALYSSAFGALGALVARQEEVAMAVAPLTYLLWGGYFLVVFGIGEVSAGWFRAISFIPPFAPFAMPARMVVGDAQAWEVVASAAVTLLCAAGVIWLGGRMYRAGLTGTGTRISAWSAARRAATGS